MLLPNPYGDLKMDSEDRSTQKDTSSSAVTSSLSDLIARLEKATSGDRLLDALIECEVRRFQAYAVGLNDNQRAHWKPVGTKGEVVDGPTRYHAPTYSLSIDAAMTLRPAGANCSGFDDGPDICDAYWSRNNVKDGYWLVTAEGKTPAIALCIAALKARSLPPNKSSGDIGERTWTPEQFWEFTEGRDGEFRAQQLRDVMGDVGLAIVPAAEIERLRRELADAQQECAEWDASDLKQSLKLTNMEIRALTAESAVAAAYENAAKIAERVGNFGDYKREELTPDFGQPRFDMMTDIASAIRAAVSKKTAESGHSAPTRDPD